MSLEPEPSASILDPNPKPLNLNCRRRKAPFSALVSGKDLCEGPSMQHMRALNGGAGVLYGKS